MIQIHEYFQSVTSIDLETSMLDDDTIHIYSAPLTFCRKIGETWVVCICILEVAKPSLYGNRLPELRHFDPRTVVSSTNLEPIPSNKCHKSIFLHTYFFFVHTHNVFGFELVPWW